MTGIVHLSDLHFGRHDPRLVTALLDDVAHDAPDLVVVSGDLTQRARRREFAAARAFLDAMAPPKLVVPGNHDIPLFDVVRRILTPLGRYQRQITDDMEPFARLEGAAVLGINTARPSLWKAGRLSLRQIERLRERFCLVPQGVFKILVTHHPFLPPPLAPGTDVVGRGLAGLLAAERCGVELLLSGHLHLGYTGDVRSHHVTIRRSILVAQAGTAVSHRTRDQANGYNRIAIELPRLSVVSHEWDGRRFAAARTTRFEKSQGVWHSID